MKQHKNIVTLSLMLSSILLLIVLQVLWLQSSYEKAFFDFRRETNLLFRGTVFAMRDSMFIKKIVPVTGDTLFAHSHSDVVASHDSLRFGTFAAHSIHDTIAQEATNVQIFVTSDSLRRDLLNPLVTRIQRIQAGVSGGMNKGFIIRLGEDTLNRDSLSHLYREALVRGRINVPFKINHIRTDPRKHRPDHFGMFGPESAFIRNRDQEYANINIYHDTIASEAIHVTPFNGYTVHLANVRALLLQEITPQILFSLFLTLTTTAAFIFMYRNIRSQQRLMDAKNDFISNVTHELKTPVATVSVALEALKNFRAMDNPKLSQEYLDIAQRELGRLSMMTDKILKTAVFESKGVEFKQHRVDLDEMIQQIIASMKLVFEKRNAAVTYEKEGTTFELMGGSAHLTNVIHNLLDNALKYSLQHPEIVITLRSTESTLTLSVKDNGIGIARDYHKKIFEKFFRVPTGDVHNTRGYGLGLNYVAGVVNSHGGRIRVVSELGKGSEFVVVFPRK